MSAWPGHPPTHECRCVHCQFWELVVAQLLIERFGTANHPSQRLLLRKEHRHDNDGPGDAHQPSA